MRRDGGVYRDQKYDTHLEKTYKFLKNSLEIKIHLETECYEKLLYVHEWNLHFANIQELTFNGVVLEDNRSTLTIDSDQLIITDNYTHTNITFEFEQSIEILITQLNTISQSEKGLDITNQGISFCFLFDFEQSLEKIIQFKVEQRR